MEECKDCDIAEQAGSVCEICRQLRASEAKHRWTPVSEGPPKAENAEGESYEFIKLVQPPRRYKAKIRWYYPGDIHESFEIETKLFTHYRPIILPEE